MDTCLNGQGIAKLSKHTNSQENYLNFKLTLGEFLRASLQIAFFLSIIVLLPTLALKSRPSCLSLLVECFLTHDVGTPVPSFGTFYFLHEKNALRPLTWVTVFWTCVYGEVDLEFPGTEQVHVLPCASCGRLPFRAVHLMNSQW